MESCACLSFCRLLGCAVMRCSEDICGIRGKFCEAGWGVVGGGVGYRDSRAVCLAMSSVTQDRYK